jgi:predicted Rossmann fold nucleotide-binding protein DprA/Smf involved in DNA uptake
MNHEPKSEKRRGAKGNGAATQNREVWSVKPSDLHFPAGLANTLPFAGEATLYGLGDQRLLKRKCLGLICSVQCPGSVVIKTFDAIRELRDAGVVVAGGFHSPMEQECLEFLLRGKQPIIICPAKHPSGSRLSPALRDAIEVGRVLLVGPFGKEVRRATKVHAQVRNEFVAAISAAILIPHASSGGKAEATADVAKDLRKPLFTFEDVSNQGLRASGALRYELKAITEHCATPCL